MPAGRPRKYENDAARQAAYRERKQPNAPMTAREMRRALADIHTWGKALCADAPGNQAHQFAAAVMGATPEETAFNIAETFRKAVYQGMRSNDGLADYFQEAICKL